ncbi:hypothetical protein N2152v2_004862 [Parachlorella kessleri]
MADGLFSQYENEYCSKSTDISRKIQGLTALTAGKLLQRMDMEARSFSPDKSRQMLAKVKEYKGDLAKLREDAKKAAASGADTRAELGLGDDYYQTSAGQRERLLQSTDRLEKTGSRIQQGRQQLLETEELGVQILSDLQRQRETILHSRDTLQGVDVNISKSRQILSSMSRRIIQHKVIMWGIILLLVGGIGLVLWAKIA